jgi:hypothetical protein
MNTFFTAFITAASAAPEAKTGGFESRGEEIAELPLDFGSSKSGQCVVA